MADSEGSLMVRLKEATRDLHGHAESRTLQMQMFRGEIDREAFAAYLGQLYLVHHALEAALARVAQGHPAVAEVARPDRRHADRLLRDLDHHGVPADSVAPCPAAGRLVESIERRERDMPVSLLGPLYVLEGSTNGSKVLARVLSRAWQSDGSGLSYLDPYGDQQPARWADFKREMDALGLDERDRTEVVEAAREAFQSIADISDEVARDHAEVAARGDRTVA